MNFHIKFSSALNSSPCTFNLLAVSADEDEANSANVKSDDVERRRIANGAFAGRVARAKSSVSSSGELLLQPSAWRPQKTDHDCAAATSSSSATAAAATDETHVFTPRRSTKVEIEQLVSGEAARTSKNGLNIASARCSTRAKSSRWTCRGRAALESGCSTARWRQSFFRFGLRCPTCGERQATQRRAH